MLRGGFEHGVLRLKRPVRKERPVPFALSSDSNLPGVGPTRVNPKDGRFFAQDWPLNWGENRRTNQTAGLHRCARATLRDHSSVMMSFPGRLPRTATPNLSRHSWKRRSFARFLRPTKKGKWHAERRRVFRSSEVTRSLGCRVPRNAALSTRHRLVLQRRGVVPVGRSMLSHSA